MPRFVRVAGISEIFTQDLEDMDIGAKQDIQPKSGKQVSQQQTEKSHSQPNSVSRPPAATGHGNGNQDASNANPPINRPTLRATEATASPGAKIQIL